MEFTTRLRAAISSNPTLGTTKGTKRTVTLTDMLILKPHLNDRSVAGANFPAVTFIALVGFPTQELAHVLDSLVRVSRRVEGHHLVINNYTSG